MKTNKFICVLAYIFLYGNSSLQLIAQTPQGAADENSFGVTEEHINNFTGHIYYIPEYTYRLPNFNKLEPVGEIYTDRINVENQEFTNGFPGVTDRFEFFAIDYKGKFYLKASVNFYLFKLCSDDGSKLIIDDSLVIDNDFQHALECKSNYVKLKKGIHDIEVQYFQGPRFGIALTLDYKKYDAKAFEMFNLSKLYPISVNEHDGAIDVSVGNEILFDFNSYELSELAKNALSEIKRIIIDKTQAKSIIIEGHTDDIGSEEYNIKLSLKRADAVKDFYAKNGVDTLLLKTMGYGEAKPKVANVDDESRKINRRIEISIQKSDK
jgi:outer membrane protein OmpA-like peptidoglycan-associated protein